MPARGVDQPERRATVGRRRGRPPIAGPPATECGEPRGHDHPHSPADHPTAGGTERSRWHRKSRETLRLSGLKASAVWEETCRSERRDGPNAHRVPYAWPQTARAAPSTRLVRSRSRDGIGSSHDSHRLYQNAGVVQWGYFRVLWDWPSQRVKELAPTSHRP